MLHSTRADGAGQSTPAYGSTTSPDAILERISSDEGAELVPVIVIVIVIARILLEGFDAVIKIAARHDAQFAALVIDIKTAALMQRLTLKRRQT